MRKYKLLQFTLLLAALICVSANLQGQYSSTLLGVEFGPKWDRYAAEDTNNVVTTSPFFYAPFFGITLAQEFNGTLRFETGFSFVNYGESFRVNKVQSRGIGNAFDSFQIPLRIKLTISPGDGQFRILPTVGYIFGFNRDFGSSGSSYSCLGDGCLGGTGDSTVVRTTSDYSLTKTFGMVQFGLSFEYQVQDGPIFSLSGFYTGGFSRVVESEVRYWADNQPERQAQVFSTGGYLNINVGVSYPISRIWQGSGEKVERDWER
jgi:hypothetical protein